VDVQLPDGTVVKGVPDGTSKSELATKLKANGRDVPQDWLKPTEKAKPPERTFMQNLGRQAGLTGRYAAEGVAGALDPINAGVNLAANAPNMVTGRPYKQFVGKPSEAVSSGLDALGVPKPETPGEKMVGEGSKIIAGAGVPMGPVSEVAQAGKGVSGALRSGAESIYQKALKPGQKYIKTYEDAIETLLNKGISISSGGLDKLHGRLTALNQGIARVIENSDATIDKHAVAAKLYDTLSDFGEQVTPKTDLGVIAEKWKEFLNHPIFTGKEVPVKRADQLRPGVESTLRKVAADQPGPRIANTIEQVAGEIPGRFSDPFPRQIPPSTAVNEIPVQKAQRMKQATYRVLKGKYGEEGSAATEAQKALARGLKEEIAKAVPEVRPLNAEETKLLNALPMVERRVLNSGNKNPQGLAGLVVMNPVAWTNFMADRSDLFKSLIARMMWTGSKASAPSLRGITPSLGYGAMTAPSDGPPQVGSRPQ